MSKHAKLVEKLLRKPPPSDFRWQDLVTLLGGFGFRLEETRGGSSHKYFVHTSGRKINTYRPHPSGIMYRDQLREIISVLTEIGLINDE